MVQRKLAYAAVNGRKRRQNSTMLNFQGQRKLTLAFQPITRVGNSVPAWSVSLWLLWRVCFDFCDGIGEAKKNAQIRGDNFKVYLCDAANKTYFIFAICFMWYLSGYDAVFRAVNSVCDGFVVRLKLMWRYHPDHVTVSSWHFQEDIVVHWRGFDGVYWWNLYHLTFQ